jgi:HlyD family secretion protein
VFTLAENLEEMRIEAGVGELDITSIFEGQEVRFTLESIPGRTYPGTVAAIYLMPTVTNNVVSYTVIINVDNRDGSLLPGMTCAVEFIAARSEGILLVPNAALRYQPSALSAGEVEDRVFAAGLRGLDEAGRAAALAARAEAQARSQPQGGVSPGANPSMGLAGLAGGGQRMAPGMGASGPPRVPGIPSEMVRGGGANRSGPSSSVPTGSVPNGRSPDGRGGAPLKTLWYLDGAGKPDCIMVIPGLSDGSYTEVAPADGGAGLEGTRVITRERL